MNKNKFYCAKDSDGTLRPLAGIWTKLYPIEESLDIQAFLKRNPRDSVVEVKIEEIYE